MWGEAFLCYCCVNMWITDSTCWSLPLELNNSGFVYPPVCFQFHVGMNWNNLNVYSSFYTEFIKEKTPPSVPLPQTHSPFWIVRCLSNQYGSLTVSWLSLFDSVGSYGEAESPLRPQRLCSSLSVKDSLSALFSDNSRWDHWFGPFAGTTVP